MAMLAAPCPRVTAARARVEVRLNRKEQDRIIREVELGPPPARRRGRGGGGGGTISRGNRGGRGRGDRLRGGYAAATDAGVDEGVADVAIEDAAADVAVTANRGANTVAARGDDITNADGVSNSY